MPLKIISGTTLGEIEEKFDAWENEWLAASMERIRQMQIHRPGQPIVMPTLNFQWSARQVYRGMSGDEGFKAQQVHDEYVMIINHN
jgi:hypothetical protein